MAPGRRRGAFPKPAFDLNGWQRFDPPASPRRLAAAAALFLLLLGATTVFLWNAHVLPLPQQLGAGAAIVAGLWGVGALSTARHPPRPLAAA